jgi:hypothetical protein
MIPGRELDCGHLLFDLELNIVKTANWHLIRNFYFRLPSTVSVYHPFRNTVCPLDKFLGCGILNLVRNHASDPSEAFSIRVSAAPSVPLARPNLVPCYYLHALVLLLERVLFRINELQTIFSLFAAS